MNKLLVDIVGLCSLLHSRIEKNSSHDQKTDYSRKHTKIF